jgi:threonine/homoserine/homoserine lactone efflux protein
MTPAATAFVEGALAGYGIAIPVGAVAVLIVNTAIACGFFTGAAAGAGAATADFVYALLASVAGAALAAALEPYADALRLGSGLVLVGLAAFGLLGARRGRDRGDRAAGACAPLSTYVRFVGITLINPLTVVYFTAFILGRGSAGIGASALAGAAFVVGAGLASLSWQTLLAALGGLAGRHLTLRFRTLATILGNLIVLALGAQVLIAVFR